MIGKTVSHYKILERLGGGGMGVVYRAEDTRLKRTVALKFLPPELTRDPEAKERFMREAQAASSLQHNNICTIHDIEETDDGQIFINMDLYEGETLKQRIEKGPLPIDEVIDISLQVAQGLSEAHANDIVHRDIKPANILLTEVGVAKIVDFGLAKLGGRTMLTRAGTTLGTVAYMSPEQARGETSDGKTDLWSLGVVLYEMLTGQLPFKGEFDSAIIYSILNTEPEPLTTLRPDNPPALEQVVRKLLSKDPSERYRSADELITDLRNAGGGTSKYHVKAPGVLRVRLRPRQKKIVRWVAGALILVALSVVIVYFLPNQNRVKVNPNATTQILATQTYQTGLFAGTVPVNAAPALSRDGNWFSYAAPNDSGKWSIYFKNLGWSEPKKFDVDVDLFYGRAEVSPNGDMIAYGENRFPLSVLCVMSSSGEERREIEDSIHLGGQWSPDGSRINYIRYHMKSGGRPLEVWSATKDGLDKRLEFADTLAGYIYAASWSPDGKSMVFSRQYREGYTELITRELSTGKERQLTCDKKFVDEPCWLSNGTILFVSTRSGKYNIWAIPEKGGEAVQIIHGGIEHLTVSASADGKKLLVPEFECLTELWISDISGANNERIKLNLPVLGTGFAIAPELSRIAYVTYRDTVTTLSIIDSEGKDRHHIIQLKDNSVIYEGERGGWSPDEKWIAYGEPNPKNRKFDLSVVELASPGSRRQICDYAETWDWIDNENLAVYTAEMKTYKYSIQNVQPRQLFEDSTYAIPILRGEYLFYNDYREGREGRWITRCDGGGRAVGKARKFLPLCNAITSPEFSVWVWEKKPGEIWKITLPDCREEYVGPVSLHWWSSGVTLGPGGKKVARLVQNHTMRLILYENMFE